MSEPSELPFDPNNRAYQRFFAIAREHFSVREWKRETDLRPVMVTLTDMDSRDVLTVAVIDSVEDHGHGPGRARHQPPNERARRVFVHQRSQPIRRGNGHGGDGIAASRAVPMHDPSITSVPDDVWIPLPQKFAQAARAAACDKPAAIAAIDRHRARMYLIGPVPDQDNATRWIRPTGIDRNVDVLVIPQHPGNVNQ
jgi:hypothetical protein